MQENSIFKTNFVNYRKFEALFVIILRKVIMLKVSLHNLKPGMVVGRSVINADGFLLLGADIVLTEGYIKRLEEYGVSYIYIKSECLDFEYDIPQVLCQETQVRAVKQVKTAFNRFALTKKISIKKLNGLAQSIVEELIINKNTLIHLTDIRSYDEYTFGHSVNVCILSVFTGIALGYGRDKLKELALGGLLHDIGKTCIPTEILNKPGKLTKEEMTEVEKHTSIGFEIIRRSQELSALIAHVAYQHHERINGTGYPRNLCAAEIHEYARIVAIADVYDALTSDRPYRKAMMPHEAYEILMALSGQHFDSQILRVFFNHLAVYPIGTIVQLNTKEIGIVAEVFPDLPLRPVVKVFIDKDDNYCEAKRLDLAKELTVFIVKVFDENETLAMYEVLKKNKGITFSLNDCLELTEQL